MTASAPTTPTPTSTASTYIDSTVAANRSHRREYDDHAGTRISPANSARLKTPAHAATSSLIAVLVIFACGDCDARGRRPPAPRTFADANAKDANVMHAGYVRPRRG